MTNLESLANSLRRNAKEHSPLILSVVAGAGTIVTAYLAAKAGYDSHELIENDDQINGYPRDTRERLKRRTKVVWRLYIPTAISATSTVTCIVFANRMGVRKTLAAQAAVSVSQQLYSEYRDKVIEEFGPKKDETIRGAIAEDKMKEFPPPAIVVGEGKVLCRENFTGRYFMSDMETLRRAQNDINAKAIAHMYATLSDFYYMIDLPTTSNSSEVGWDCDRLMDLDFVAKVSPDGRPCLGFDYNYIKVL